MRVWVRREDINNGQSGDPWSCPVALALKRKFGKRFSKKDEICVGNDVTDIGQTRYNHSFLTQDFIKTIDQGSYVKPRYIYLTKEKNKLKF